jgi:hypothetical protein
VLWGRSPDAFKIPPATVQPVILLGGQQHELALAAPGDLDRPSEASLDDLAGSIVGVG